MRLKTSTFRDKVCLILLIVSALYIIIRLTMVILTQAFELVIYSRTFGINLWNLAWTTDIIVAFFCHIASFLYFRRKAFSFLIFVILLCSIIIWWPAMIFSKEIVAINNPSLKDNYAISQNLTDSASPEKFVISVRVYKEVYPLLYKYHGMEMELVSRKEDAETISLFNKKIYTISEDGKTLSYGKLIVPLE